MFTLPLPSLFQQKMITLLKNKDKEGFDILYDCYSNVTYGVGLHITEDEELAEQIVENTFIFIWNNIDKYNPSQTSFDVWIFSIVRGQASTMNFLTQGL
jgi:RNA polymerase sigma-70 factor (ECF subfamily)